MCSVSARRIGSALEPEGLRRGPEIWNLMLTLAAVVYRSYLVEVVAVSKL